MSASEPLKICMVGWGAISRRAAALWAGSGAPVRIVAVAVRDRSLPRHDLPKGARLIGSPDELLAGLDVDMVVEAAGRSAVAPWGRAALGRGADFLVSSTSAFVDETLLADLMHLARANHARIIIPPGALGGMDALAAASLLPLDRVSHEIVKPPAAWRGTPAEKALDLGTLTERTVFFSGTARQAADAYPQNANVAVISALAGIGLDRTRVSLVADPAARLNGHAVEARGAFGRMRIVLENAPLATNPKSSELTALNLVRSVENRRAAIIP